MATYDLLSAALKQAMQDTAQGAQYVDVYRPTMEGYNRGINDAKVQRAADYEEELRNAMSGIDGQPELEQIRDTALSYSLKYGDLKTSIALLEDRHREEEQLAKQEDREKSDLAKKMEAIARGFERDPDLGRLLRNEYGMAEQFPDEIGNRLSERRKPRGSAGKTEKFVTLYDEEGNPKVVRRSMSDVQAAYDAGLQPKQKRNNLDDEISNWLDDPQGKGADMKAKEETIKRQRPPQPKPPAGYEITGFNEETGKWKLRKKQN